MKGRKVIIILYSIVLISTNILAFVMFSNYQMTHKLFQKRVAEIQYSQQAIGRLTDVQEDLIKFAKKNHILIMKYEFLSGKELAIYSTDEQALKHMKFPYSTWKIRTYSFKELRNVGCGNTFFMDDHTTPQIEKKLKRQFSTYGKVKFYTNEEKIELINNLSPVYLIGFGVLFLIIGFTSYYVSSRKKLALMRYWGYSNASAIWNINKDIIKFLSINEILWLILWLAAGRKFEGLQNIWQYFRTYLLCNMGINTAIFIMAVLMNYLVIYFQTSISHVKGKNFFTGTKQVSYMILTSIFFALLMILSNTANDMQRLQRKEKALEYWDNTKHIYTINFRGYDNSVTDLSKEQKQINDELSRFYQEGIKDMQVFLMNSDNYAKEADGKGGWTYAYQYKGTKEEQICLPYGRSVRIDENYLKRNPIKTCNGKSVKKQIEHKKNTLNLLVPEQYKKYEKKIIKQYKDEFYFQKVTVDNDYRKALKQPKNLLKKKELAVHIIYVKRNQSYFTYDSDTGNDKNQIIDPIAVLFYADRMDSSNIAFMYPGELAPGSVYFEDNSREQGHAFRKVEELEKKLNIYQFNSTTNVYGMAADQLVKIQQKVIYQGVILAAIILCSIIFITISIYGYYYSKRQKLMMQSLFGYHYLESVKEILIVFGMINIGTTFVVYAIKHNQIVWYFMIFACIIEFIITKIEYDHLNQKNLEERIIKGEQN